MKKQPAEETKSDINPNTTEFWETVTTSTAQQNAFEDNEAIIRQPYLQKEPKGLPHSKVYLRKIGWRILPIIRNGEKNIRH